MDIFKQPKRSHMTFNEPYFWTASIHQWKKLLQPDKYKDILIDNLATLVSKRCVNVYGFVIMPNHLHLLWEILKMNGKEKPQASLLKYSAHSIKNDLQVYHPNILEKFYVDERDRQYRFWQNDPCAINVYSKKMAEDILDYIHLNPLQEHWSIVEYPENYYYSSADFYLSNTKNDYDFLTHYMDRF